MLRGRSFFMLNYFWVCLGGAIGSGMRFWVSGLVAQRIGQTFPFGTLAVNVSGSFIIGILAAMTIPEGRWMLTPVAREFLMIGICGGYTTFSSFSLQTLALAQDGEWLRAGLNSILSFALCLIAVWIGHFSISLINKA
jgi:fluoride exporter